MQRELYVHVPQLLFIQIHHGNILFPPPHSIEHDFSVARHFCRWNRRTAEDLTLQSTILKLCSRAIHTNCGVTHASACPERFSWTLFFVSCAVDSSCGFVSCGVDHLDILYKIPRVLAKNRTTTNRPCKLVGVGNLRQGTLQSADSTLQSFHVRGAAPSKTKNKQPPDTGVISRGLHVTCSFTS